MGATDAWCWCWCWCAVDRCTGAVSADVGTGVAARVGGAGTLGVGEGASAGADVDGVADARGIGAPIGDLRGAAFAREGGASAVARCTGAPSPGRAGGVGGVAGVTGVGAGVRATRGSGAGGLA
ncbi:hypothetical protein ACIO8G_00900 [Streptomyces sp. NPDC087219]|uniref:hypothetical protein n=1 Tax=Streptomyces sp. NPDC087219 TaxID=3365770 RepID=UPI00382D0A5D